VVCWLTLVVYTVSRVNKPLGDLPDTTRWMILLREPLLWQVSQPSRSQLVWYARMVRDLTVLPSFHMQMADRLSGWDGCLSQRTKYAALQTHHIFQPIAVETLGPINESLRAFLDDLGRWISVLSGDDTEHLFLFQRISVAIQRFNSPYALGGLIGPPPSHMQR